MYHEPVFTTEVTEFLKLKSSGIYVDVTLGGGGWAEAILKGSDPDGYLVGFDRDSDAICESEKRLSEFGDRFLIIRSKFSDVSEKLKEADFDLVDGIVADLGVSSHQLNLPERGFSFSKSGRLDMRMNSDKGVSAMELVNSATEKDLADWFFKFGEERFSRRIARKIVSERKKERIETTGDLAKVVARAFPHSSGRQKIHPATRVFQALRIKVNDELNELTSLVKNLPSFLKPGGRFIVVSYHSLEDRIVKRGFLSLEKEGDFQRITKKPLKPSDEEVKINRRARSACLRVLERV